MDWDGPILDNHLHLHPRHGRGIRAVEDFIEAGGTHLLVVNKPSWSCGVEVSEPNDFEVGFEATLEIVSAASERLPGRAWAVLGVHPALITRLVDERGMSIDRARSLMVGGIDRAAAHVRADAALAIKSGRPHYSVSDRLKAVSNRVMRHAFKQGARSDCAVQLHTESRETFEDIPAWARTAGMETHRVVKHYADGLVSGPTSSVIARRDALQSVIGANEAFLMETDYLDDPDRPGAVLGPKTVPRRVRWLLEQDARTAIDTAHVKTPASVYGIDTQETLAK